MHLLHPPTALHAIWTAARALQLATAIPAVGLLAHFTDKLLAAALHPAPGIAAPLGVACAAALYGAGALVLALDDCLPLLAAAVADSLLLIASIAIAAVYGRELAYVDCRAIGDAGVISGSGSGGNGTSAYEFAVAAGYGGRQVEAGDTVGELVFAYFDKGYCMQTKAIWGLFICLGLQALCCTFAAFTLWLRGRSGKGKAAAAKGGA